MKLPLTQISGNFCLLVLLIQKNALCFLNYTKKAYQTLGKPGRALFCCSDLLYYCTYGCHDKTSAKQEMGVLETNV